LTTALYGVAADVNRESDDKAISQAYRRVVRKVHPDKGGSKKKFQTLQVAKEAWDAARQGARPAGNPALSEGQLVLLSAQSGQYRVHLVYLYKPADLEAQTTRGPGRQNTE